MDKETKRIFRKHFSRLLDLSNQITSTARRNAYLHTLEELTDIYADICGILYDEAEEELYKEDDNDED